MTAADRHPPEYVLAELAEGVLEDGTSTVSKHVRNCLACQSAMDRLTEVTRLLHAMPDRLPMPAQVSERISAALNEEAIAATAARERAEQKPGPADARSSAAGPVAWFRRRMPVALTAAAATAFVGFFGYTLINDDSSPDMATSSEGVSDLPSDTEDEAGRGNGGAADTDAEAGGGQVEENTPGLGEVGPLDVNMLGQTVQDIWETGEDVQPGCGQALAEARGAELVGSTDLNGDVLIVLEDEQLTGWIVADCGAAEAGETPDVAVPLPEE